MGSSRYDALIVGSGAAGSFAAKELTERGLKVLLLEAGRDITPANFPTDFQGPREKGIQLWARARASVTGQPIQAKVAFYGQQLRDFFVKDSEHPYTSPPDAPFLWIRGKQLGGRLHTYGRMLLRWSDLDFKAASRDGEGKDWPIAYADLDPYYSKVEEFLRLRGCPAGAPAIPDGHYAGPSKLTEAEKGFKSSVQAHWPDRVTTSWRYMPPNALRVPQPILAARQTGLLTERTDAVVTRVLVDEATGKATGVEFVDRNTLAKDTASAGVVMLCGSTIETVRLMLNSASDRHPNGLGNRSGALGRYFMDQVPSLIMGTIPGMTGNEADDTVPADPFYGVTGGMYVPRFSNVGASSDNRFLRGFGFQGTAGRLFVKPDKAARFAVMGFGEMIAHPDNRITLNARRKDRWGMPIPHIACRMRGNELAMLKAQEAAMVEMSDAAGFETEFSGSWLGLNERGRGAFPDADPFSRFLFRQNFRGSMTMGAAIHETGGARMGDDPSDSVLNPHNQSWEVPNLFVTDGSSFTSSGCAGATLTIMALTVRACEHIAREHGAGRL